MMRLDARVLYRLNRAPRPQMPLQSRTCPAWQVGPTGALLALDSLNVQRDPANN
jgi:hypothetical protein